MESFLRAVFQYLGRSRAANGWARKYGMKFGAGRFVAGNTLETAIAAAKRLNEEGKLATLDHLGEFVGSEEEAAESARMCLRTLQAIEDSGVKANLSLKLTSLGLDIGQELCLRNMRGILDRARTLGNFVRIDMEDYAHCRMTLDIFRELRKDYDNVGAVLQAYLYRSEEDVRSLSEIGANLRLVKGAYKESPKVAFPGKRQVDDNFRGLIRRQLSNGHYCAIATHDSAVIEDTIAFIREKGIAKDRYEFQMLYGISESLQRRLASQGYRVRIYVPFGIDWFGYYMRRLAERPANVWFVLKNRK